MSKKRRKYTEIKLDDKILEEILKNIETERKIFFLEKNKKVVKREYLDSDDCYLVQYCTQPVKAMVAGILKDIDINNINPISPRFCDLLFNYIEQNGQKDSEVYKEAHISKQVFSNIRKGKIPTYSNVVKLALAIHCTIKQFESLINSAGYSIQGSNPYDLVIRLCFVNRWYLSYEDFYDVFEAVREKYPTEQNRFQDWYKEE